MTRLLELIERNIKINNDLLDLQRINNDPETALQLCESIARTQAIIKRLREDVGEDVNN